MSRPQVEFQLFRSPSRLAGRGRTLTQGRTVMDLAGSIAARSMSCQVDAVAKLSIGFDFLKNQNTPVECVLLSARHICNSPGVEDHSTPIGFADVQISFAGFANADC